MKAHLTAMAVAAVMLAACGGDSYNPTAPTPLPAPPAPAPVASSWVGDQTMVSCSGRGCSDHKVGDTFSDLRWEVVQSGSSIELYNLDSDMAYRGTIEGRRFVATYPIVPWDYDDHARIEGEFAPDSNSFEAVETYFFGTPEGDRADWHWRVARLR